MEMKLPMRFRILQLICENDEKENINTEKIKKFIFSEYGNEGQCRNKTIDTHIMALKSVGLIEEAEAVSTKSGIVSKYKATSEGYKRLKFFPKNTR
jgi:hypothetical protein